MVIVVLLLVACVLHSHAISTLHRAIEKNDVEATIAAIENGADVNEIDSSNGQTPTMKAVLRGYTQIVEALLPHKPDLTIGEKDGYTPMHGAGFQGRADIVPLLISSGLEMDEYHSDGYTPFHRACWGREQRHTDTVQAFLSLGVDPRLPVRNPRNEGFTCVQMTGSKRTRKLVESYLDGRATPSPVAVPAPSVAESDDAEAIASEIAALQKRLETLRQQKAAEALDDKTADDTADNTADETPTKEPTKPASPPATQEQDHEQQQQSADTHTKEEL